MHRCSQLIPSLFHQKSFYVSKVRQKVEKTISVDIMTSFATFSIGKNAQRGDVIIFYVFVSLSKSANLNSNFSNNFFFLCFRKILEFRVFYPILMNTAIQTAYSFSFQIVKILNIQHIDLFKVIQNSIKGKTSKS